MYYFLIELQNRIYKLKRYNYNLILNFLRDVLMLIYRVKLNIHGIMSVKYLDKGVTKYAMMKSEDMYFPNNLKSNIFIRDKDDVEMFNGYNEIYSYLDDFLSEGKHSNVSVNKGMLNIDTFDYMIYPKDDVAYIKAHKDNAEYLIYYRSIPDVIHSITKGNYYMLSDNHKKYLEELFEMCIQN